MRTLLAALCLTAIAHAVPASDRVIVPAQRVGAITKNTSEAQLKKLFGPKQVKFTKVSGAEGQQVPATVVLPNSPDRLEIFWKNNAHRTQIESIVIDNPKSHWHTPSGVHVGTPLQKLVELNGGKRMQFSGFDWDYGGGLSTGPLLKTRIKDIAIELTHGDYDPKFTEKEAGEISGDRQVWTDNPLLRRIKVTIGRLFVSL